MVTIECGSAGANGHLSQHSGWILIQWHWVMIYLGVKRFFLGDTALVCATVMWWSAGPGHCATDTHMSQYHGAGPSPSSDYWLWWLTRDTFIRWLCPATIVSLARWGTSKENNTDVSDCHCFVMHRIVLVIMDIMTAVWMSVWTVWGSAHDYSLIRHSLTHSQWAAAAA